MINRKNFEDATLLQFPSQNKVKDTLPFPRPLSSVFSMECVFSVYFANKKSGRFVLTFEEDRK